jgi:hypothetical protein
VSFLAERSFLYGVATRISTETSTHSPRRRASDAGGVGCSAVLAGPFKCANLLSHRLRKIDEGELPLVKEVILSTLVDNSHKVVFGRLRIG